jgi:hypothetical protein
MTKATSGNMIQMQSKEVGCDLRDETDNFKKSTLLVFVAAEHAPLEMASEWFNSDHSAK